MQLTASESKKLEALRAKANLNAKEQAEMAELEAKLNMVSSPREVTNPEPVAKIVGIAEIKLRNDNPDKPVMLRLTETIGETDILLLSAKQADSLAMSINIFDKGADAWKRMKTIVGNRRSEIEVSVQLQKKGSTYVNRDGVIIIREEDGYSVLPQMIILPTSIQAEMDTQAVKSIVHTWTSSARFLPKANSEPADEER